MSLDLKLLHVRALEAEFLILPRVVCCDCSREEIEICTSSSYEARALIPREIHKILFIEEMFSILLLGMFGSKPKHSVFHPKKPS